MEGGTDLDSKMERKWDKNFKQGSEKVRRRKIDSEKIHRITFGLRVWWGGGQRGS